MPLKSARQSLLVDFVETYMPLAEREQSEFEQIVAGDQQYAEVEEMVTVYEQRGIEKGKQEGRQDVLILQSATTGRAGGMRKAPKRGL